MLNVDKFFYDALRTSADVVEVTEGRIYNPARTIEQETEDAVPYIIITYDGGSASGATKDEVLSKMDQATVSILIVADSRDDLADITEMVHGAIDDAFNDDDFYDNTDWNFYIEDADESASAVQYDPSKPCCYQTLTYRCSCSER